MLKAIEVKPDVYWVGGVDWNERSFHGYTTERGSTYNAYLIMDEKIALVDTCKAAFADDLLARVADVVDPARIDYIVSNHGEPDHSGALPKVAAAAPNAKVVTGDPKGAAILRAYYGDGLDLMPVKTGDGLELGRRTLSFVQTPMVHWPDNMVAYDAYDRILFSNDAFGQHLATSKRFDDEMGLPEVLLQARKYYANIVMPYGRQVRKALDALRGLDLDLIAPSHGVIWRSHIADALAAYDRWSADAPEDQAVVAYDSMWHTTEAMAQAIAEGFVESGVPVRLCDLKCNHISDIMADVLEAKYLAVGSPTLNSGMMPTVAQFLCYLKGLAPRNRVGIAFGSYGWAPAGPNEVQAALEAAKLELPLEPLTRQWADDEEALQAVRDAVIDLVEDQGDVREVA